ncbi:MAG: EamA family transporter [Zoogloeaceae bacterium]|nr:EamA family transporter [Zoogloeaceae bacterium]
MARLPIFLLGALFSLVWTSAYIAVQASLAWTDPLSLVAVRILFAGFLMLSWIAAAGRLRTLKGRATHLAGLVLGVFNYALYMGLSFSGLKTASTESVVLIAATAPFFAVILAFCLGETRSWRQVLGMLVGFLGVYVVLSSRLKGGDDPHGMLLVLAGTVALAIGTVWYRHQAMQIDAVAATCLQNLYGGLVVLCFSPDPVGALAALSHPGYALAMAHLVAFCSIFNFLLWFALLRRVGTAQASSFHLLNPLFGIFLSAWFFGTPVRMSDLAGAAIVLCGIAVVSWRKKSR